MVAKTSTLYPECFICIENMQYAVIAVCKLPPLLNVNEPTDKGNKVNFLACNH